MKRTVFVLAALLAGFLGGVVGTLVIGIREHTRLEQVVRARSFELVNDAGQAISYWGVDKGQNVVLAFGSRPGTLLAEGAARPGHFPAGLDNPRNQLAAVGLLANDSPFLKLRGADGKTRVRLYLNDWAKPLLLMEDETGPRVGLGIEQSDTPGPQDNDWTLTFDLDRARIGMYTEKEGGQTYVRGIFSVKEDKAKYP
jgi:hypothetical protein